MPKLSGACAAPIFLIATALATPGVAQAPPDWTWGCLCHLPASAGWDKVDYVVMTRVTADNAPEIRAFLQANPPPKRGTFRINLKVSACPDVAACKSRFFTKAVLTPATHAGPIVVNYRLNFPYDDKWQRVHAPRLRPGRRFEFGGR